MTIIELAPLDNGAHRNQTTDQPVPLPEGWAVVPESMLPLESFPFGEVSAEDMDGVPTVTGWTPLPVPDPEPEPEPERAPTTEDIVKTLLGG